MIGVSLSYKWLLTGEEGFGLDVRRTLTELHRREVDSIELRTVLPGDSPHVRLCFDMGHYMCYLKKHRPNESICIERLTILPFMGRHFRPVTHKGADEYGIISPQTAHRP